jgi:PST family polysaccharide transporter
MQTEDKSWTKTAMRGGALVGAAQGIRVLVQLVSIVVLSRLLSPADFGLMASVAPVITFITLFQDLGMQQAVIQRRDITPFQINQIFWTTAAFGTGCALVIALISPGVAWFYHDPRLTVFTAVAAVPILIASLASLPIGLLNRQMQFGQLARLDIIGALLAFVATVIGAWAGMGYWALLLTPFLLNGTLLAGGWMLCRFRPSRLPWPLLDREIAAFGSNLTGFNFMNYFARNLDNILIGRYNGAVELGYYDRAYKLLLFPLQNINAPLSRVMVPLMSRAQEDLPHLRDIYLRTVRHLTLLTVPGMAGAVAVSHEMVLFLFGPKWLSVAPIFACLGLAGLLQPLHNSTGWLFISQGKTRAMLHWGV